MRILKLTFFLTLVIALFSTCQKEYSVEQGGGNSSGTWEFQEGTVQYKGNIDSAVIGSTGATKILKLDGKALTGQPNFSIKLFTADSFVVGSYSASLSQSNFDYFTAAKTIFKADFFTGEFTVSITTLSNNRIEGTFNGQAEDSSGNATQITLGKFSSTIDLTNNRGSGAGDTTAVGTLGATAGECTPVFVDGVYTEGVSLSASNTAEIEVNVTTEGTYNISTDMVNGISFSASGSFAAPGVYTITLNGTGTPVASGDQSFTVTFGASNCVFPVTFLSGSQIADGTLGAIAGTCTPVVVEGVYTQGISLAASNTAQVEVTVTTPGTYEISTNTVNGITFSTTGTFPATGVYNVILNGDGIPVDIGDQNFTVTFGASTCVFPVTFLPETPPVADYFPTTASSSWAYGLQGGTASDSVLITVLTSTPTFDGKVYSALEADALPPTGSPDTSYFRKSPGDYFEYIDPSNIFLFDSSYREEYIFLKDNVAAGTTFQSPDFTGTVTGIPATAYIKMTILEKGVAATVGTLDFTDVIKVKYEYFLSIIPGTAATEERWFARDVGLIRDNIDDTDIFNIGRFTIF